MGDKEGRGKGRGKEGSKEGVGRRAGVGLRKSNFWLRH